MLRKFLEIPLILLAGLATVLVLGLAGLYVAGGGHRRVPATTAEDPGLPSITVGGYRFHGQSAGDPSKPVVIVLHGGPGGDYRALLPLTALADEYFVVFYDQRGSGLSPRVGDSELTVDQYVKDLDGIVDHVSRGRKVAIIGHSWGAMLASIYIGRYPGKVVKAVLAEPGFLNHHFMELFYDHTGLDRPRLTWPMMRILAAKFGQSLHVRQKDGHERRDYLTGEFFTADLPGHPLAGYYPEGKISNAAGEFWRFGARAASRIPPSGMTTDGRMMDMTEGIENWPGTALFLSGSANVITGPDLQREQMKLFPRAELVVIRGAGHTMFGEKPDESLSAVRRYLETE